MRTVCRVCGTVSFVLVVTLVLRVLWGTSAAVEAPAPAGLARPQPVPAARLAPPDVTTPGQVAATYGQLPLPFEANQGQSDGRVQFLARSQGMHVFLTATEAVLVLPPARPMGSPAATRGPRRGRVHAPHEDPASSAPAAPPVVRLSFVGANPTPQVVGLEELPGTVNYFLGNDPTQWRTNIPTYAKVKYRELYPGVDVLYYGNPRQLEYDVIVAPGADPSGITLALALDGMDRAQAFRLDAAGDVVLATAGGTLRLHQPVVYQTIAGVRHTIACRYVLGPGTEATNPAGGAAQLRVQVAAYDRGQPLIIDPVLRYATYLGGSDDDYGWRIAVDGTGKASVTGRTESATFPITPGAVQPTLRGYWDAFVSTLNATGTALVYSTYLGGSRDDQAWGIALDGAGQAYVTGITASDDFPTTPGAFQPTRPGGSTNAFVTKLDATGALGYSTYLGGSLGGGSGYDEGSGIAVDGTGQAYVTGHTASTDFPTTPGAVQPTLGGGLDAFVSTLNATGTALVYSTYLGGSVGDEAWGVAVDGAGNAYVTGHTMSADFPTTPGAVQPTPGGGGDAFVTKLTATGTALRYSTFLGGSGSDHAWGIAVDGTGKAYVTGDTFSADFPTTPRAVQPTLGGVRDVFVTKLTATGTALGYSTYLGGSDSDSGYGIAVDRTGKAYVTGHTASDDFPTTPGAVQPTLGDVWGDAFVTQLTATGTALRYSTFLGGRNSDSGRGIAVERTGTVYVTGLTHSTDFPTTLGAVQPTLGGHYYSDAFVTKLVLGLPDSSRP